MFLNKIESTSSSEQTVVPEQAHANERGLQVYRRRTSQASKAIGRSRQASMSASNLPVSTTQQVDIHILSSSTPHGLTAISEHQTVSSTSSNANQQQTTNKVTIDIQDTAQSLVERVLIKHYQQLNKDDLRHYALFECEYIPDQDDDDDMVMDFGNSGLAPKRHQQSTQHRRVIRVLHCEESPLIACFNWQFSHSLIPRRKSSQSEAVHESTSQSIGGTSHSSQRKPSDGAISVQSSNNERQLHFVIKEMSPEDYINLLQSGSDIDKPKLTPAELVRAQHLMSQTAVQLNRRLTVVDKEYARSITDVVEKYKQCRIWLNQQRSNAQQQ